MYGLSRIFEAHRIARKVEKAIKARMENVYDIMIHVEPSGNMENEGYGLSEKSMETPGLQDLPNDRR